MSVVMMRLNGWVGRLEWAGWSVLVVAALMAPWAGIEPPVGGDTGVGMVWLDAIVTAALWAAFSAQVARVSTAGGEHPTIRLAGWLMLVALGMICGRLAWLLAAHGDVRMTVSMAVALLFLAAAVILHALGRVAYGQQ